MTWLRADYDFPSLFSYRIPGFSSQYALASPLPGPSTIKMALVATAIRSTGNVSIGEKVFNKIRDAEIAIVPPKRIAISNVLIRRLKKKRGKVGIGFQQTFGIRGYAHFSESLRIYIDISEENANETKNFLLKIRYLGSSDSLVYCKKVPIEEEPPVNSVKPIVTLEKSERKVLMIPIKDINPAPTITFEDLNPFQQKTSGKRTKKKEEVFINKFYPLHIIKQEEGKNWVIYEFE